MGEIHKLLTELFLRIDSLVYGFISVLYQKFIALASLKMFNDAVYARIENAVYMIVGVFALFLIAYNILKHMIEADFSKSATDIKKIIINLVTSMFMIMLVPLAFNFLFSIQNSILKYDLIGKLFQPFEADFENSKHLASCQNDVSAVYDEETNEYVLSNSEDITKNIKLKCYGNLAALQMFQGFYYPAIVDSSNNTNAFKNGASLTDTLNNAAETIKPESASFLENAGKIFKFWVEPLTFKIIDIVNHFKNGAEKLDKDFTLADAYDVVVASGDFAILELFNENVESGEIKYTYLISTIAGLFVCYVLFLYCLDVAVRTVKLAFYQMIAPFPIMMRVVPKKGTEIFNNWLKCVSTTYFEVFSRLAIVYFGMYFISNVFVLMGEGLNSGNIGYDLMSGGLFGVGVWLLVKANIILGIFAFMKKAPDLLKEIVPSSSKFSLKLWDHLKDSFAVPATLGGFVGGMALGGGNPLAGIRAAGKGWKDSSLRGIGAEEKRRRNRVETLNKGVTRGQLFRDSVRQSMGRDSLADENLRRIDDRTEHITNATGRTITYNGKSFAAGEVINVDNSEIELMEAQIANNKSKMVEHNNKKKAIDKEMSYNDAQITFKSNLKSEAEKKIDEKGSKEVYTINYIDSFGKPQKYKGNFEQVSHFIENDLTPEQRQKYDLNAIRDEMINSFIDRELKTDGDNKTKQDFRAGLNTIINNGGYEYKYYGKDENGNQIINTGRYDVLKDEKGIYNITQKYVDNNGLSHIRTMKQNEKGDFDIEDVYTDKDGKIQKNMYSNVNAFAIVSDIDKAAKASNGVSKDQKQDIDENEIQPLSTANEDIQSVIDGAKDMKEADKKSMEQKALEASKSYTARNNNGGNQ